jgi:hypothetical protein
MSDYTPDIRPFELDAMKVAAQKAPFDIQRQFLAMIEAYEDSEDLGIALNKARGQHAKIKDVIIQLERLKPTAPVQPVRKRRGAAPTPEDASLCPYSDDAWNEHLAALATDADRDTARAAELARARTNEAALIARVAELEEGVADAISDLGEIEAPG